REVFVQALRRLGVPFVQCLAEADREIAALANRWGCPVLSLDSDFCVFDLAGGYCPLSGFQWQDVRAAEAGGGAPGRYIPALCFSAERFCGRFGRLQKSLLPLFAVMSGNDYADVPALEGFFSKVRLPEAGRGKHGRMRGLLRWLAQFGGPEEAVDDVLRCLRKHQREEVRELLRAAMEDYRPSDVKLEDFFQEGRYECEAARSSGLPPWVLGALARGELSPFVSDALILRSTFLHVQVENMQQPSAHSAALLLRQVIYGLLLRAPGGAEQPPAVCEFGRVQKSLKKTLVEAASLPAPFCDGGCSLEKLTEVPMSCRQLLLLETLGVDMSLLEPVPGHLQLPAAVTCYWTRSDSKVNLHQLKALLLMIVSGELQEMANDPDPPLPHAEDDSTAYNQFLRWKEEKLQSKENKDFDLDAAHSFCQWQCCLQMGLYLNQLLSSPLPEPDLARLYSGTLVHRLYQELKSTPSVENLFSSSPKMTQLYRVLLNTVKS
ncbi:ASTE1 protein, partial [Alectura lathami]|nr:ASTE1 protein [Alectura lathami]